MPLNLLKRYNSLLDIGGLSIPDRNASLMRIFDRDIRDNEGFAFRGKIIRPINREDELPVDILFKHLTTVVVDEKTKKRDFDIHRSQRLHWVKYHIEEKKKENVLIFSAKDKNGKRTYIYDKDEFYVIVLEPKTNADNEEYYYFLTAYHLRGRNKNKIKNKYKRRLSGVL